MSNSPELNFRDLLSHDHQRLDALLQSVLELTHANVWPELGEQWIAYEGSLLSHLDAEETFLLPGLAKHDDALAARIGDEHTKIRALLTEIGVGLQLHILREERMLELASFLREHAKMEEKPLYTWADAALSPSTLVMVARRLRELWRRIDSPATAP